MAYKHTHMHIHTIIYLFNHKKYSLCVFKKSILQLPILLEFKAIILSNIFWY